MIKNEADKKISNSGAVLKPYPAIIFDKEIFIFCGDGRGQVWGHQPGRFLRTWVNHDIQHTQRILRDR